MHLIPLGIVRFLEMYQIVTITLLIVVRYDNSAKKNFECEETIVRTLVINQVMWRPKYFFIRQQKQNLHIILLRCSVLLIEHCNCNNVNLYRLLKL